MNSSKASVLSIKGGIDTHVHVFRNDLAMSANRRYEPVYNALADDLEEVQKPFQIARTFLVQPSFLGFDNRYIIEVIAQNPAKYAGIAVVPFDVDDSQLQNLKLKGIVGVRLNLIGVKNLPDCYQLQSFAEKLAKYNFVLEIQAQDQQWQALAVSLANMECKVLIDHFGRINMARYAASLDALMDCAQKNNNLWFKFSAPYRSNFVSTFLIAQQIFKAQFQQRIVWGSDWPWTQFESQFCYEDTLTWLAQLVNDEQLLKQILTTNPKKLYDISNSFS
ncbi:amidohydrolase family protein (plasmid) [Bartonella sp. HY329]|uniref:amidohydrolase family protein n=1 Tax=unclassified Bartonella TaxID=2645622 RepID=UPI0021C692F1|nr:MULTISPECIES: amidohydrolase family protein [unclassified Bartonella]UXM96621.1 amidohydrolase family protein [Bartonella sp. HY329]UXN10944.1 amidohydrolase family protein [Bartonella sp. HY328]